MRMDSRRRSVFFVLSVAALTLGMRCATATPPLPTLTASEPAADATVSRSAWFVLEFDGQVDPASHSRVIAACDGWWVPVDVHALEPDRLVVRSRPDWPADTDCVLMLSTEAGMESVAFQTLADGAPFVASYDPTDPEQPLPFPDDYFLVPDASTPTGLRPDVTLPTLTGAFQTMSESVLAVVEDPVDRVDGWSPIGNITLNVSRKPDVASLPMDRAASLDPLSSVALIDMTPGSPTYGERIPFQVVSRTDKLQADTARSHNILVWPGIPLEPMGTYGLVVTDRVVDVAGEPLKRSDFSQRILGPTNRSNPPPPLKAQVLAAEVTDAAEDLSPVPIPRQDVVLALRLTIRSTAHFSDDILAMREQVLATPPNVQITSVTADPNPDVAAVVEGTLDAPLWMDANNFVTRGVDGLPEASATHTIPFILTLPLAAETAGGAPVVIFQHGSSCSPDPDPANAAACWILNWQMERYAPSGIAVAGISDSQSRDADGYGGIGFVTDLIDFGRITETSLVTFADQMALLQALQSMGTQDLLPAGAPDGVPDLDPTSVFYEGQSMGSVHGQAFLAYAPEILAGVLVVGGNRQIENDEYLDRTGASGLRAIADGLKFVSGTRAEALWMGFSLVAITQDHQDPHNHTRLLYRDPIEVDGTTRKPSLLVVEGIDDPVVTANGIHSLAWVLGSIPHLAPALVPVPDLVETAGPIQGNVDADTTAAFVQYAPDGAGVPPSPGCIGLSGHICGMDATEGIARRIRFFQSALVGVPVID